MFKKLGMATLAAMLAACGGNSSNSNKPIEVGTTCTTLTNCSTSTEQLLQCNNAAYELAEDCALTSRVCREVQAGTFNCVTLAGEFETCSSDANCDGLDCVGATSGVPGVCLRACDPAGTDCEATQSCNPTGGANYCIPLSQRGELCLGDAGILDGSTAPFIGCAAPDACVPIYSFSDGTSTLVEGVCGATCPATDVNTVSTCQAGELCLRNPSFFSRVMPTVTCTDDGDCAGTDPGAECVNFTTGSECGVNLTTCAPNTPLYDGSTVMQNGSEVLPDQFLCGVGAPNASGASPVTLCGLPGTTAGDPTDAVADCLELGQGLDFGLCVARCDNGTKVDTTDDLDCGTAATCEDPPSANAEIFTVQDPMNPVMCMMDGECTNPEFPDCRSTGGVMQCVQVAKICQAI